MVGMLESHVTGVIPTCLGTAPSSRGSWHELTRGTRGQARLEAQLIEKSSSSTSLHHDLW